MTAMESKVLVIYTGGTIGMLVGAHGYQNERNFLTEVLRSQNRFHDPLQASLFSNSSSIEGYRQWSKSGRSSPRSSGFNSPSPADFPAFTLPTLTVRSCRPIGTFSNLETLPPSPKEPPKNVKISEHVYEAELPSLVTPPSSISESPNRRSIRYAILEWHPLLDSSNIEINDWIRIATEIELNYSLFDAFVVLHGTDTMAYSSSALSFLLEDLGKTVILTGAQIPLSALRNDGVENFLGALTIAGHFIIPEVCVYFNHSLFRGNRVSKMSSYDLNAFASPNFPPLVDVGIEINVHWNNVIRQTSLRKFSVHKKLNPRVAVLRLFPGMDSATIKAFFMPPIAGIVLETFGAGNAPQRNDLMDVLREACDRGVVVVAITQCPKGTVSDAYETGRKLLQTGVVPGVDMTPECALAKISYLLSKPELSIQEVCQMISTPLRGELTRSSARPPAQPAMDQNLENIQNVLSQFVKLTSPSHVPKLLVSNESESGSATETAAPWTWTAGEAASTEAVLMPFLVHLAVARNDLDSLNFCFSTVTAPAGDEPGASEDRYGQIAGGLVNCLDSTSGRSPLHVAALNGHQSTVQLLLQSGALVHLRDFLDHTALYYAARQGHEAVADILLQAGAALGGQDVAFASHSTSYAARRIWTKLGVTGISSHG